MIEILTRLKWTNFSQNFRPKYSKLTPKAPKHMQKIFFDFFEIILYSHLKLHMRRAVIVKGKVNLKEILNWLKGIPF